MPRTSASVISILSSFAVSDLWNVTATSYTFDHVKYFQNFNNYFWIFFQSFLFTLETIFSSPWNNIISYSQLIVSSFLRILLSRFAVFYFRRQYYSSFVLSGQERDRESLTRTLTIKLIFSIFIFYFYY